MDVLNPSHCRPIANGQLRQALWCAFLCVVGAMHTVALGQVLPNAGTLLEENKHFGRTNAPDTRPEVLEAPVRPTIKLPDGATVSVAGFQISGARSFASAELMPLVAPWIGQTLDINGLNEAAGAITRFYQGHGHFLSYAYLPAQKVEGGVIEIQVLEGRVDHVEVATASDVRLSDEVVQAHVGKVTESPTVLQPALERQLLLLNDIPGVVARAAFTPSDVPGKADMVVSVAEEEPLGIRLDADNEGASSTGQYRLGVDFQFRDLFGVGDNTQARLIMSDTIDMVNGSVSTRVPVTGRGLTLGGGISRLSYQLGGSFVSLGGVGTALVETVNLGVAAIRSLDRNLSFQFSVDHKGLDDQIVLTGADTPKRSNVLSGSVSYDQRDKWLGAGSLSAAMTLYHGRLTIGGTALAQDQAGLQTDGSFSKAGYDLWRLQSISGPISVFVHVQGQYARKNLDSSEKFDLGGPTAVRAYAVGEATLDDAQYASLELRATKSYVGGTVVWSAFHDHGWGQFNVTPLAGGASNRVVLYANGVGVQWTRGNSFGVNASLAVRGPPLSILTGTDPRVRVYMQVFQMY